MYVYNSMVSTETKKSVKVREFEMPSVKFIKFHDRSEKSRGVLLIHHSYLPLFLQGRPEYQPLTNSGGKS